MKTIAYGASVIACGAALVAWWPQSPVSVQAQPAEAKKDIRTIHASGSATVRVAPDSARLYFTITSTATTVKDARAANDAIMKKVKTALQGLNIKDLKMKTVDINVRIVEERPDKLLALPKILGYSVVHQFTVLVENEKVEELTEQANKVLDTALENGVNGFNQLQLFRKTTDAMQREAMTKAVEDAMINAKALAKGIPTEQLEIIEVKESASPFYGYQSSVSQNVIMRGDESSITLGNIETKVTVSIVCKY